jgi:hypothetical protein
MTNHNLRVEQRIRQALTGNPFTDPVFRHEGPKIIRWITGGPAPSIYAYFHQDGDTTILYCPWCGEKLGWLETNNPQRSSMQIAKIRETGSQHQQQHPESKNRYTADRNNVDLH